MKRRPMVKVLVSLPPELVVRVDAFAKASYRRRSGEIAARLEESMAGESIDAHGVIVRRVAAERK